MGIEVTFHIFSRQRATFLTSYSEQPSASRKARVLQRD